MGGKCTAFIQRHSLCSDGLSRHGGMGSASKDTASGFQHGDMKRLRDYISKSYAELGLWVAKHRLESTCNVILDGLRSFIGSHQRETAKRQVYGSWRLKSVSVELVLLTTVWELWGAIDVEYSSFIAKLWVNCILKYSNLSERYWGSACQPVFVKKKVLIKRQHISSKCLHLCLPKATN